MISDATGETLLAAGRAAAAQYVHARAIEHVYPLIRTEKQIKKVLEGIDAEPGIVLYTILGKKCLYMLLYKYHCFLLSSFSVVSDRSLLLHFDQK